MGRNMCSDQAYGLYPLCVKEYLILCSLHNNSSYTAQYPYRSVQIVLRLYTSPAEILAGFDVDAPCCAYDGESPRTLFCYSSADLYYH